MGLLSRLFWGKSKGSESESSLTSEEIARALEEGRRREEELGRLATSFKTQEDRFQGIMERNEEEMIKLQKLKKEANELLKQSESELAKEKSELAKEKSELSKVEDIQKRLRALNPNDPDYETKLKLIENELDSIEQNQSLS